MIDFSTIEYFTVSCEIACVSPMRCGWHYVGMDESGDGLLADAVADKLAGMNFVEEFTSDENELDSVEMYYTGDDGEPVLLVRWDRWAVETDDGPVVCERCEFCWVPADIAEHFGLI